MAGSIVARMDNTSGFRGWDLWLEGNRLGTHVINAWPDNALKAVARTPLKANEWYHVAVTYDGSRKAAGIKIFLNGAVQEMDVQADKLTETTRTGVPFCTFSTVAPISAEFSTNPTARTLIA